jgi:hypothetical protein
VFLVLCGRGGGSVFGVLYDFLRLDRPKHPTHALQRTDEATPFSGTPWQFTGGVWEVTCCSGGPEWAQNTAKPARGI